MYAKGYRERQISTGAVPYHEQEAVKFGEVVPLKEAGKKKSRK